MKAILICLLCLFATVFSAQFRALYGTTSQGAKAGTGPLTKFVASTNELTIARSFERVKTTPYASFLQASNGLLLGVTWRGGNFGFGVIYWLHPLNSNYAKLIALDAANSNSTASNLIQVKDGKRVIYRFLTQYLTIKNI